MSACEQNMRQKAPSQASAKETHPTMCPLRAQPGADNPAEGEKAGRFPVPQAGLGPGR